MSGYKHLFSSLILSLMDDLKYANFQTKLEITRWLADDDYRSEVARWASVTEADPKMVLDKLDFLVQKHVLDKLDKGYNRGR